MTTFTLVRNPPRRRLPRAWLLLGFIAIAGLAAAGALTVTQRADTASLFAERYHVGEQLIIAHTTVAPVPADASAVGVEGSLLEMSSGMPLARTALARDHWAYEVVLEETTVNAVASGTFVVHLSMDGSPAASVYLQQSSAQTDAVEGARILFDIGATMQPSSLYFVQVRPFVQTGPTVDVTIRSNPNGNLTWSGVGGGVDGVVNPDFTLATGSTLRLTAMNAEDQVHNVGIKDSAGNLVDPPGWSPNIDADGEQETITWTPSQTGTYSYQCQYHPTTMRGTLAVAAS